MLRDKFFVITGPRPWGGDAAGNVQRLAEAIARQNRVLYVNPPQNAASLLRSRKAQGGAGVDPALRMVRKGLWVLDPPIVLPAPGKIISPSVFDYLMRRNNRQYASAIRWALAYLDAEELFLVCGNAVTDSFYLKECLEPLLTVYYRQGAAPLPEYLKKHVLRIVPGMSRKCDLIATSDDRRADEVRRYNCNTFNIGRAGDMDDDGHAINWDTCAERLYTAMTFVSYDAGMSIEEPFLPREHIMS